MSYEPINSAVVASAVVRRCLLRGVCEFVICAGARNAAIVEALCQAEKQGACKLWRHFEERSAAFFALGRCMKGNVCAVVTTSGTAVAELHAAVIEAHYQARPLVLITADRPEKYRGTGAPQSMEQRNIFSSHAFTGEIENWQGHTPFHWNVELEEECKTGILPVLSDGRPACLEQNDDRQDACLTRQTGRLSYSQSRPDVSLLARWLRQTWHDGFLVMLGGLENHEQEEVYHFLCELKVPVIADATSGLREALADFIVPDERLINDFMPAGILRIGDVPSGRLWRDLENFSHIKVWNISRSGFSGLARESQTTHGSADVILKALGSVGEIGDALGILKNTSRRFDEIENLLETFTESEPAWLRLISTYASLGNSMYLGNSMPIRLWNQFAQWRRPITNVRANRGVNGIDGQLSTWLGNTAEEENAWCIIGDLTALYDLAAPYLLEQCTQEGRMIIVLNNFGGKIFERLPRLREMSDAAKTFMLNPHQISLKPWAELWHMNYLLLENSDDVDSLQPSEKTTLVEVRPSAEQTKEFWQKWDEISV